MQLDSTKNNRGEAILMIWETFPNIQIVTAPFEGNSKKPDEVRRRIVELLGDVPRIELFAREKAPGWDAWGDEV